CLGSEFSWNGQGYIFDTYPFTIHGPKSRYNPGYSIILVNPIASTIRVRAKYCHGAISIPGRSCVACLGLGPSIEVVRDWAKQSSGQSASGRLSHDQLAQRLILMRKKLKVQQSKVGFEQ
ncbi:hypothetical protein B0H14DRAFT_2365103, partial [Mycena olivaceomarginata]